MNINTALEQTHEKLTDDIFRKPELPATYVDQRLHMAVEHGRRIHFTLNDGRYGWATVIDFHRTSQDSAYKVLLSDNESTIWITAASIDRIGRFDNDTDIVPYLSSVMNLPIVVETYVNFWYNTPVWHFGEIEATAIDIEGNSVLAWVDGWQTYARFSLNDIDIDELALESVGNEYEEWLDSLAEEYAVA